GRSTLDRVHDLIYGVVLRGARPPVDIDLIDVKPCVLMEDEDFQVSAFPVNHRGMDCFGYCFEEKSRRPFLNEKAEALNVPRGPERRDLVQGKSIRLDSGQIVTPDDVLGPPIEGTKVCITGDTSWSANLLDAIQGADLLVSEATYLHHEEEMARLYGHLPARQAAEIAAEAGVSNLALSHISRRYRERDVLTEAQAVFPQTVVARDFDHYIVKRGEPLTRQE
ncbi:MAG: MBL fold metallo-hydrolase, partial [Anaerolineae bacterium]